MINQLTDLPDGVIGFEASGKVTGEDYEKILVPALAKMSSDGSRTRLLYVLGPDFEGYEAEAAIDDMKMGADAWGDFEKIAFVTDHTIYRGLVRGFGFLMPGEVKVYPMSELATAQKWLQF